MRITIQLTTDESIALRRMANDRHPLPLADAAGLALRDWLIANGYLELDHELDEDTDTAGSA